MMHPAADYALGESEWSLEAAAHAYKATTRDEEYNSIQVQSNLLYTKIAYLDKQACSRWRIIQRCEETSQAFQASSNCKRIRKIRVRKGAII